VQLGLHRRDESHYRITTAFLGTQLSNSSFTSCGLHREQIAAHVKKFAKEAQDLLLSNDQN
jgi:hypothetical protein